MGRTESEGLGGIPSSTGDVEVDSVSVRSVVLPLLPSRVGKEIPVKDLQQIWKW